MSRGKSDKSGPNQDAGEQKVNLRELAEHLGLSVATVSLVIRVGASFLLASRFLRSNFFIFSLFL